MNYEEMGIAAMIPGMQHLIELMQQELDQMRRKLAGVQANKIQRRGRPLQTLDAAQAQEQQRKPKRRGNWWAKLSPEEVSKEMRRRALKRKDRVPAAKPDKSEGMKGYWAKMSEEQRKAEMRRRAKVRNKNWEKKAGAETKKAEAKVADKILTKRMLNGEAVQ